MAKKIGLVAKDLNPDAIRIAQNIDALHANGHSYMDVPLQAAIAYNSPDVTQTLNMANVVKTGVQSSKPRMDSIYSDPKQNKVPTMTQQAISSILGQHNRLPATEADVAKIQKQMIINGYGAAPNGGLLTANGVWTPEWQAAFKNASYDKLLNPEVGIKNPNLDAKEVFVKALNALRLPVALNTIWGAVASMPRSILNLAGDAVSGQMNPILKAALGPVAAIGNVLPEQTALKVGEAVANVGGERQTLEEFKQTVHDRWIQDIGTMLTLIPMGKLAYGITTAAKAAAEKGLFTVQPFESVAPKYNLLKSIQASVSEGTESVLPRIFPRIVSNLPGMGWTYRGVNAVAKVVEQGIAKSAPLQMAVRDMFAQRLRLPTVQLANEFMNSAMLAGGAISGIAAVEGKGKIDTPLDNVVYSVHPIQGPLAAALDVISMQANPTRSTAAIKGVAKNKATVVAGLRDALDNTGVLTAWQKANPDVSLSSLIAKHGEGPVYQHIVDQLNFMAAEHETDLVVNPLKADVSSAWHDMDNFEQYLYRRNIKHDVWSNSADANSALKQARESIVLNQNLLENAFRSFRVEGKSAQRAGKMAEKAAGESRIDDFMQARNIMSQLLAPEAEKYLIHVGTIKAFNEAKTTTAPITEALPSRLLKTSEVKGKFIEKNILAQFPTATKIGVGKYEKWYIPAEGPAKLKSSELAPWETEKLKLDKSWVEANNILGERGAIGLARVDSLTRQQALAEAGKFKKALANATPEQGTVIRNQIFAFLNENFGMDVLALSWMKPEQALEVLTKNAKLLAEEIYPVAGAPKIVTDLLAEMRYYGYKPVSGTDIGHYFTKDLTDYNVGTLQNKLLAKATAKLGLGVRLSSPEEITARTNMEQKIEIQKVLDKKLQEGNVVLPPGWTADYLVSYIYKQLAADKELNILREKAVGFGAATGYYKREIAQLIEDSKLTATKKSDVLTRAEAIAQIKKAKAGEYGMRDAGYKHLLKTLTDPLDDASNAILGRAKGTPLMSKEDAQDVIRAIWRGRLKVPSDMIGGLAKIEDWLYAGLPVSIGGKTLFKGLTALNIPNYALAARNMTRFETSLTFAYRRVFKTMAKGVTEYAPPTMYPAEKMRAMGIYEKADALYKKMYPKENIKQTILDDTERLVQQADLFNIFSPKDFTRWNLWHLHEQGYRGQELLDKVEHIMTYGARTAAERTLNAIYYPFSFNKTVMRQFGTYLLTNPGQRLIIANMISAFDSVDLNGKTGQQWLKDIQANYPLIKELEKLNAFKHGIGLGGYGGINAPYGEPIAKAFMTILGPKEIHYTDNQATMQAQYDAIKNYLPLLKTTVDLISESIDTGRSVAGQAVRLFGANAPGTDIKPTPQKFMPAKAQQEAGWEYRSRLITMLSEVLDYNYKHPNSKFLWSNASEKVPTEVGILDKPISKSTIDQLVHYRYPAWDNTLGLSYATQKKTEADRFIGEVTAINPALGQAYREVDDYARKLSDKVSRDNISEAELVVRTLEFRKYAIELANRDKNFERFYKDHYERLFGPLEGM